MTFTPTPIQVLLLWRLLFTNEEPMQSKIKPMLKPAQRKELIDAGFIKLEKRGRAKHVILTDVARAWAAENTDAKFSYTINAAAPFHALLKTLKEFSKHSGIPLSEILNPTGPILKPEKKPPPLVDPAPEESYKKLSERIKNACYKLAGRAWNTRVRIAKLKETLLDVSESSIDRMLLQMEQNNELVLYPLDDPGEITAADQNAAIEIAGRLCHILYMTG